MWKLRFYNRSVVVWDLGLRNNVNFQGELSNFHEVYKLRSVLLFKTFVDGSINTCENYTVTTFSIFFKARDIDFLLFCIYCSIIVIVLPYMNKITSWMNSIPAWADNRSGLCCECEVNHLTSCHHETNNSLYHHTCRTTCVTNKSTRQESGRKELITKRLRKRESGHAQCRMWHN